MGNGSSIAGEEDPLDPFDGVDTLGYRVLGVQPDSPAAAAGLVSFLDFLVGVNDKMLLGSGEDLQPGEEYDDVDLPAILEENKGKEVEFLVWNIKSQAARLVKLIPSDTWGGAGLLGVTIRLDNYAGAEDRLIRVLSVEPNSPAAIAGLIPEKDFLLGTTHQTLDSVDRLAVSVLRDHIEEIVEIYVYNTDTDKVRVVALMPTYSWGDGRGLLGAEVGTGYLHRLPSTSRATSGTSVERRVRYVNESEGGIDKDDQMMEMEPQLEMEEAEEDDPPSNDTTETNATEPASTPIAHKDVPPTLQKSEAPEKVLQPPPIVSSKFPPPPLPKHTPTEVSKPALTHATSTGSTSPPTKPTRQASMQPGLNALGPPPKMYHGRQAYTDSQSASAGYKRPTYIMPPSPPVLPQQR